MKPECKISTIIDYQTIFGETMFSGIYYILLLLYLIQVTDQNKFKFTNIMRKNCKLGEFNATRISYYFIIKCVTVGSFYLAYLFFYHICHNCISKRFPNCVIFSSFPSLVMSFILKNVDSFKWSLSSIHETKHLLEILVPLIFINKCVCNFDDCWHLRFYFKKRDHFFCWLQPFILL